MRICFLGTGAADWDVDNVRPGKDFRRFSSAVIDDTILIDAGPCVFEAAKTYGVDLSRIKYVLQTHSHRDHFCEDTMDRLLAGGAVHVTVPAGEKTVCGEYTVYAMKANHGTCTDAVHYIVDDGEKRIFYGMDGAWLMYDEVARIREKRVNLMVLDGTIGDVEGDYRIFEHNNLKMIEIMKETLSAYADRFVISHMAKTLHVNHSELEQRMQEKGIETAYDGWCTEI